MSQYERKVWARQREWSPDGYQRWRALFPWTDAQFAAACDAAAAEAPNDYLRERYTRHADGARAGRISVPILRLTVPRLVTRCGLCGKKALYRYGIDGRCSDHRLVRPGFVADRQRRQALAADDFAQHGREAWLKVADARERRRRGSRLAHG